MRIHTRPENFRLALCLLIFCCLLPARCSGQAIPFRAGEMFRYQIKWNFWSGGTLTLQTSSDVYLEEERAFHLEASTATEGAFKRFYPFRARVESFVSQQDFLPLRYQYSSWMPRETFLETTDYPRGKSEGVSRREKYKNSAQTVKDETFDKPPFFQDPLSIIFYLRTQNFAVGDQIEVPINAGGKNYKITVKVLRKTRIRVLNRVWDAFILEPGMTLQGVPFKMGSLWLWLSADEQKIPLYLSARAPLGVVSCTLVEMKR